MLPFYKINTKGSTDDLDTIKDTVFEGPILEVLAKFMNFTVQVVDCFYNWGKKTEDGSWNGIIGSLIAGVT